MMSQTKVYKRICFVSLSLMKDAEVAGIAPIHLVFKASDKDTRVRLATVQAALVSLALVKQRFQEKLADSDYSNKALLESFAGWTKKHLSLVQLCQAFTEQSTE